MGFAEVNVCWHKLTPRNRLHECTIGWFESLHLLVVYNRREMNPPCHMFGGTAILTIGIQLVLAGGIGLNIGDIRE